MTLPVLPRIKPADLSGVANGRLPGHLLVTIDMAGRPARCHPQMARALRALLHDCRQATGVELTNVGHYRSFDAQVALLKARYVRASSGTRFWDGSWWRKVTGATVATPGTSDHGWGLAIDAAVRDPRSGQAAGVYRSAAWNWIRQHLTRYGLCWAWADEGAEPWHWHLFEIGAPAVLAHEAGTPPPIAPPEPPAPTAVVPTPEPAFDPANRRYWLYPLNPQKDTLHVGSTGDTVRYLQGVCVNEVSRFAAWFGVQEPERLPDGNNNPRKLYLRAAADECAKMAVDGNYDESVARAIMFVQHAFSDSNFDGRPVGRLAADGWVGREQTWPFIDTLADGTWAA
jgi:hypothetical protein